MTYSYDDDRTNTGKSSYGFDLEPPPAWQERGLCAQTDPESFFPEKGGSTREAKKICGLCDVRDECLQYALENDERFGIWGGHSERERRAMKKKQPRPLKAGNCANCGTEYLMAKHGPARQYCSQSCRQIAADRRRAGAA